MLSLTRDRLSSIVRYKHCTCLTNSSGARKRHKANGIPLICVHGVIHCKCSITSRISFCKLHMELYIMTMMQYTENIITAQLICFESSLLCVDVRVHAKPELSCLSVRKLFMVEMKQSVCSVLWYREMLQ